jgi:hypothetical protein
VQSALRVQSAAGPFSSEAVEDFGMPHFARLLN